MKKEFNHRLSLHPRIGSPVSGDISESTSKVNWHDPLDVIDFGLADDSSHPWPDATPVPLASSNFRRIR